MLTKYRTTLNGHETIVKLNAADAKAWIGGKLIPIEEPEVDDESGTEVKARRGTANKARSAQADKS